MNIYTGWPKGSVSSFTADGTPTPCIAYLHMSEDHVASDLINGVSEAPETPASALTLLCPICGISGGVVFEGVYDGHVIRLVKCTCQSVFATTSEAIILYSMSDSCLAQLVQEDII